MSAGYELGLFIGAFLPVTGLYLLIRRLIAGEKRTGRLAFLGAVLGVGGAVLISGIGMYFMHGHDPGVNEMHWTAYATAGAVVLLVALVRIVQAEER